MLEEGSGIQNIADAGRRIAAGTSDWLRFARTVHSSKLTAEADRGPLIRPRGPPLNFNS